MNFLYRAIVNTRVKDSIKKENDELIIVELKGYGLMSLLDLKTVAIQV